MTTLPALAPVSKLPAELRGLLGMIADRLQAWPGEGEAGDGWAELSARFVGVGLGVPRMTGWRLLKAATSLLGLVPMKAADAERAGVVLAGGARRQSAPGTVYRVPAAVARVLRLLLAAGVVDWHPPAEVTSRVWWKVEGIDPNAERGTCRCPHPHHEDDPEARRPGRARCAYRRLEGGTWALTCQICQDGEGRPLAMFARRGAGGVVEASLSHRSHAHGGRSGEDDLAGFTSREHAIRSKRRLGIALSYHEEREAERLRVARFAPPAPPPSQTSPADGRPPLSRRDETVPDPLPIGSPAKPVPDWLDGVEAAAASVVEAARRAAAAVVARIGALRPQAAHQGRLRRPDVRTPDEQRRGPARPPARPPGDWDPWVRVEPATG